MPRITETVHISKGADALWRDIGHFGAVGDWHPMVARVHTQGGPEGTIRLAESRDGSKQVERLLEAAPGERHYRYKMETTPLPVSDYVGEFRVDDNGDGTSTIAWSAEFQVRSDDEAGVVEMIRAFLKAGLDNLRSSYGGPPA